VTLTRRALTALAATAVLALATGCTGGTGTPGPGGNPADPAPSQPQPTGQLSVSAAASLTEPFTALGTEFEAVYPGVRVRFNFGGSSALARQLVEGAPVDVFAAASPATMAQVVDAGAATGQPVVFIRNRLVIAVPRDNPARITTPRDLTRPGVKVALCAAAVPCGAAARTALAAAGVRVVPVTEEQDVKAVLTKVGLGEVDAGLVYRSDVKAAAAKVSGIDFAEAERAVNDYSVVATRDAGNPDAAAAFIGFVTSARARVVLTEAGFLAR